ncbi:maleylpyruvate isomerase N-terminal domain-containing protein [Amycolatopsis cynarae]|uniref:Maleylpyruvate isomerase N-terminal domain-containing protein n=1 Tax=Amycolatopsis cynarae TaxID=2995223 RepID=A0ABY7B815_9PSEU|nr:maleylpyruvate isomerase N-terminal domain-containing protein [Amycolatopsis sp. HUAS 11-8]WAL68470.1 maleylpyruvate isomerase N-terminal domain-containing protein [Amycolatopsis sp. HUAS 11-8]
MIDKDVVIPALIAEWAAIDGLLASLSPQQWRTPTALPGWSVQDVVAHMIGTECTLGGEAAPASEVDVRGFSHVHNDIGVANELWVQSLRDHTPEAVLERFRSITASRRAALERLSQEEFDAPSWTPAGPATYGRFLRIRVFDCWMHEQDIRDAVGMPGHGDGPCAEVALSEVAGALGYIVGKRAAAAEGAAVTIELTGPMRATWHVVVDGRAKLVETLPHPATTRLRLDSHLFSRLAGGRVAAADHVADVEIDGEEDLGVRVVHALPFTI